MGLNWIDRINQTISNEDSARDQGEDQKELGVMGKKVVGGRREWMDGVGIDSMSMSSSSSSSKTCTMVCAALEVRTVCSIPGSVLIYCVVYGQNVSYTVHTTIVYVDYLRYLSFRVAGRSWPQKERPGPDLMPEARGNGQGAMDKGARGQLLLT